MQNTSSENITNTVVITKYVPSSSDKKRAIMMYLFLGIMVGITKKNLNSFEYYHLKQASGRWILFLLVLIFDVVLLFIPIIKYLGLIPLIVLLVFRLRNIKQARDGEYSINKSNSTLDLFSGVGAWFLDLFEIGNSISSQNISNIDQDISKDIT